MLDLSCPCSAKQWTVDSLVDSEMSLSVWDRMGTTCKIQSLQAAKGERYSRVRIEGGKGLTSKLPSPLSSLGWVMFVGKSSSCLVTIQTNHRWLASRSSLMRCIASPDLRSNLTALYLTLLCKGRREVPQPGE